MLSSNKLCIVVKLVIRKIVFIKSSNYLSKSRLYTREIVYRIGLYLK